MTREAMALLEAPERAGVETAALLEREPSDVRQWLLLVSAVHYERPELVSAGAAARLLQAIRDGENCRLGGEVLQQLITGAHGSFLLDGVMRLAGEPGHAAAVYEVLAANLAYAASWAAGLLDADALIELAGLEHLRPQREFLVQNVIERCLLAAGGVTAGQGEFLAQSSPYCLYYLEGKPAIPPRALHEAAERRLGQGARRVLMVHNIDDGQGDEIMRVVPLAQALLDFNPDLEVVLVTRRVYLYAHPRIKAIAIGERDRVRAILGEPFDAATDFFESNVRAVNHDCELEDALQAHVARHRPFLFVSSTKGYHRFVFERVDVDGQPMAGTLGLDRQRVPNTYETTCRLIAELGLPLRGGEETPRSETVLAGVRWPEAESLWIALTRANSARKPVALLSPFGGIEALKGYVHAEGVAMEVRRLTAEGFFVVVMPNGNEWGGADRVREAIQLLAPEDQRDVDIAPDPAGDAKHADYVMRLATWFVSFADLIVTVEGWMMHEAYCLGKPYRVLMLAYSHPAEWHPYCRSRRQDVYPACGAPASAAQPGKFARLFLLRELCASAEGLPYLRRAVHSEDRHIRLAAARSLGVCGTEEDLRPLLRDSSHEVRGAAAEALIRRCQSEPALELQLHKEIARDNRDWGSVIRAGVAARHVLDLAVRGEDPVVRREGKEALRLLDLSRRGRAAANPERAGATVKSIARMLLTPRRSNGQRPRVLILTPVKDAEKFIGPYSKRLLGLSYPKHLVSIGLLESDSRDETYAVIKRRVGELRRAFGRVEVWKKDFGYRVPDGQPRWAEAIQMERRIALAKSRNHLLLQTLADEDWVLWLDVDVIAFPEDIVERLLAAGKDIVQPHCVVHPGGPTFDRNAWRYEGRRLYMDDLRAEGEFVKLDGVGGTMLLIRGDIHRDGLVFPAFPYSASGGRVPGGYPETEGLGLMANDMGHTCWGMPHLEIRHVNW